MADQRAVNAILHRDTLVYRLAPPTPARKVIGTRALKFYVEGALKTWDDLDQLVLPDLSSPAIRGPVQRFMAERGDYATILSKRVGISATYLAMGMEHFFPTLADDPALVREILGRYAAWAAGAARLAKEMGFDIFQTSDDIAGKHGLFWSPALFREIVWPHMRTVAEAVREAGIFWTYHSDGDLWRVLPDLVNFGITTLNPIEPECMEIREVRAAFPALVLIGNVDLLARGAPADVRRTVQRLIRDLGPSGRYAVSSGNSVPRYARVPNVRAMCDAVLEFGAAPVTA
ncbi:MAG: hypothetical protein FJ029_01980 [Actinobacteria bacterium]|nr:hypothetical protein [Actinomycetota bacterium]